MIIAPAASPDGAVYFAKNSNRLPGECQPVVNIPAVESDPESLLSCTYITIPQEPNRHGVLLSKPWWAWGGEMGANDRGVVIGCEPLFSRDGEDEPGLIGADLVRLGLERGRNARDALEVVTSLLQTHGQGGFAGSPNMPANTNNGFLIADAQEAWLLETAGRHWAARRVKDVAALSTDLTIGNEMDRYSYACPQYARRKGWLGNDEELDFRHCFRRRGLPFKTDRKQQNKLLAALQAIDKQSPLAGLMQLARYRVGNDPRRRSQLDVARYAGGRDLAQTNGSMVVRLSASRQDFFFTATAAPDLAIYKPIHFGQPLENGLDGVDLSHYHDDSLWWRQEHFHRAIILTGRINSEYLEQRSELEKEMIHDIQGHKGRALVDFRWNMQQRILIWEREWREKITARRNSWPTLRPFSLFWKRQSRRDRLTFPGPPNA